MATTSAEVETILDWAAEEGWNPGLADADAFRAADPRGFLLGRLAGRPVAAISLVRYDRRFAFLGCYIVRPAFRGQGHGLAIWQAAIARAGRRTVGLDGVPAQQPNYRRSGFVLERRNLRYTGVPGATVAGPADARVTVPVDARSVPLERLVAYDRAVFPTARRAFLELWLAAPGAVALASVEVGVLRGYGVLRPCRSGWKIGPLFADDPATAESLFAGLVASAGDGPVSFDVPETNVAARELAERAGFVVRFETARMYAGPPPREALGRVYGVTTFELG